MSDVSCLAGLTRLSSLNLDKNLIVDRSPMAGWPVSRLSAANKPITSIQFLEDASLHTLDISNNLVSDLSPVVDLPKLHRIDNPIGGAVGGVTYPVSLGATGNPIDCLE